MNNALVTGMCSSISRKDLEMGLISLAQRRKRIIFLCAFLGVGGYASYRVYKSSFVSKKRKRIGYLLLSLSKLVEAFAEGIETTSLITGDLKAFLISDDDEVPRSVRQTLKIAKSREFQDALTSFWTCVSRGVMTSIVDSGTDRHPNASRRRLASTQRQVEDKKGGAEVHILVESKEHVVISSPVDENDKHVLGEGGGSSRKLHNTSSATKEGLPERLMQKLFTDAGKGFASAVLGSVAKNATLSFLEGMRNMQQQQQQRNDASLSSWESRGLSPDVGNLQLPRSEGRMVDTAEALLELASSSKGRSLIAECIQIFVGTAVSVYLDKTKDVNIYEDLVAGMTKPSHQPGVKDLFTSVCNGAVETLVRTSHEVLSGPSRLEQQQEQRREPPVPRSPIDTGKQKVDLDDAGSSGSSGKCDADSISGSSSLESDSFSSATGEKAMIVVASSSSSKISLPNWLEGLSKTLAVPSNRKLLIDVAGTVTSEAIHSFFEVFLGIVSPYLRRNLKFSRQERKAAAAAAGGAGAAEDEHQEHEVVALHGGGRSLAESWVLYVSNEMLARSLVVFTVLLAVLMHVFVDVPALQPTA